MVEQANAARHDPSPPWQPCPTHSALGYCQLLVVGTYLGSCQQACTVLAMMLDD